MLRSRRISGSPAASSAAGVAFLGETCVSGVCSSVAPLTGAGVAPRVSTISRLAWSPASAPPILSPPPQADLAEIERCVFVDGLHEPDIRSGAGVEVEAGVGAGGQAWPRVLDRVFHADAPPLLQGCRALEIRQIVRCQWIDDASGMDFINGGMPVGRERHAPAIGPAQPFQPARVEQPEP
jgi:hypothetical protein